MTEETLFDEIITKGLLGLIGLFVLGLIIVAIVNFGGFVSILINSLIMVGIITGFVLVIGAIIVFFKKVFYWMKKVLK